MSKITILSLWTVHVSGLWWVKVNIYQEAWAVALRMLGERVRCQFREEVSLFFLSKYRVGAKSRAWRPLMGGLLRGPGWVLAGGKLRWPRFKREGWVMGHMAYRACWPMLFTQVGDNSTLAVQSSKNKIWWLCCPQWHIFASLWFVFSSENYINGIPEKMHHTLSHFRSPLLLSLLLMSVSSVPYP